MAKAQGRAGHWVLTVVTQAFLPTKAQRGLQGSGRGGHMLRDHTAHGTDQV